MVFDAIHLACTPSAEVLSLPIDDNPANDGAFLQFLSDISIPVVPVVPRRLVHNYCDDVAICREVFACELIEQLVIVFAR